MKNPFTLMSSILGQMNALGAQLHFQFLNKDMTAMPTTFGS